MWGGGGGEWGGVGDRHKGTGILPGYLRHGLHKTWSGGLLRGSSVVGKALQGSVTAATFCILEIISSRNSTQTIVIIMIMIIILAALSRVAIQ